MIICFDLDGTLLETHTDIAASINFSLENFGLPPIPASIQREFRHYRLSEYLEDVLNHLGVDDAKFADELGEFHHATYHKFMCKEGAPFEGVRAVIDRLQSRNQKVCILTNKPQYFAEQEVKHWFSGVEFDMVLGTVIGETHKPHADFIDPLYEKIACNASEIIYIGDTLTDYQFAQNCGIHFIGAGWGYDAGGAMRKEAAVVCDKPIELLDSISALNHN